MPQAIATRTSSTAEAPKVDLPAARELAVRKNSMEHGFLPEPIPTAIRSMLQRRQAEVSAALTGASRSELEEEVSGIMLGFPSMRSLSKLEAQVLVRKYAEDLVGLPIWAIKAGARDISRGAVSDLNPDFAPSAARVRQQAQEHMERVEREARDLRKVLMAQVLPPEKRERSEQIVLGFQKLQQDMRAFNTPPKEAEAKKPQTMTPEQLKAHYSMFGLGFKEKPPVDLGDDDSEMAWGR